MNNASSLTDEQINQMLIERGLKKTDASVAPQQQLTDDQIRQMMQVRGLSGGVPSPLQTILNIGGGIAQGAESAVAGLENIPRDVGLLAKYLGVPGVRQLARLPAVHAMPAPFAQQQALTTQIPQAATEALGILGTGGAAGIRGAAAAGRGIGRRFAPITGRTAKETASNFYNELVRGRTKENLHTILNDKIKTLFENAKSTDNVNYDYVKRLASERGYTENAYTNPLTGISKGFPIDDYTSRDLLKEISPTHSETKKALEKFSLNKSYPNAHELQSKLFKEASNLKHSVNPLDTSKATRMFEARQAIKDDIYNTFKASNNGELTAALQNASDFHKNQVVPFTEKKMLADMLYKRKGMLHNPEGIFNYLKKEEDNTRFIKNKLSPEDRDLFIAHGVRPAFVGIRKVGRIKPTRVINEFDKLEGKGLREFIRDDHYITRNKIENQYDLSKILRKYGMRGAEIAGAGAIAKKAWETF